MTVRDVLYQAISGGFDGTYTFGPKFSRTFSCCN